MPKHRSRTRDCRSEGARAYSHPSMRAVASRTARVFMVEVLQSHSGGRAPCDAKVRLDSGERESACGERSSVAERSISASRTVVHDNRRSCILDPRPPIALLAVAGESAAPPAADFSERRPFGSGVRIANALTHSNRSEQQRPGKNTPLSRVVGSRRGYKPRRTADNAIGTDFDIGDDDGAVLAAWTSRPGGGFASR